MFDWLKKLREGDMLTASAGLIAGLVQLALAAIVLTAHSHTSLYIEHRAGVSNEIVAGVLATGGILLLIQPRDHFLLILATTPFLVYILLSIIAVIEQKGSYSVIVVYIYSLLQTYLLYAYQRQKL